MKEFEKIIGYEAIKNELIQISDVLANNEAYQKLGVSSPQGLLLHGEPGVGKTLMASAVIMASGRKAFVCRKDKPNGDFVKAIQKTFTDAAKAAPSIVFLDDMDKFANGDERHRDSEEYVTVQSCIDEVKGKEVFVLATANSLRALPESLLRAGRFDRVIMVTGPRGEDAVKIIDHYIKGKKFVGDMDAANIARLMKGRSCAELETLINEAGLYAGFERSDEITMEHFMKAFLHNVHNVPTEALKGSGLNADLTNADDIRTQVVYHEAGHATVREVVDPGSVTLISAFSNNGRPQGFTSYCSDKIRDTLEDILVSLGGMAAIEQKFGIVDIGASRDLERAFDNARDLVTENCTCGFNLYSYGYRGDSDDLKAKQEQATAAEIERYYKKTKEILSLNSELFEAIAKELSEKGFLTSPDIRRIKDSCRCVYVRI